MDWISVVVVGFLVIVMIYGIILTMGSPFNKPKHHDSRKGSYYYYQSNKKR